MLKQPKENLDWNRSLIFFIFGNYTQFNFTNAMLKYFFFSMLTILCLNTHAQKRLREFGLTPGVLTPGKQNSITDVTGVLVGHKTLIEGDHIRTGVTALLAINY